MKQNLILKRKSLDQNEMLLPLQNWKYEKIL